MAMPQTQFIDRQLMFFGDYADRQVPTIQKMLKTVEIPQMQFEVAVTLQTVRTTVMAPQVQFVDTVVDLPDVMKRTVETHTGTVLERGS